MKFVLLNKTQWLYIGSLLLLPAVSIAHIQYVYVCSKEGLPITYRDTPCAENYQQKIIARYVKPSMPMLSTTPKKKHTANSSRGSSKNKIIVNNKYVKNAEQQKRQRDHCDSVKERISIIESKYRTGYKASQKPRLDRSMQTLRRLAKKYCVV